MVELARAEVQTNPIADRRLRDFAGVRIADAEVGCHQVFKKYGLSAAVEIEKLELFGMKDFPYIPFSTWAQYLLDTNRFTRQLCGCRDFNTMRSVLTEFWSRYHALFPNHEIFSKADAGEVALERTVPFFSHTDEGRSQKHDPLWVLSCHGALGRGTRLYLKMRKHRKAVGQNEMGLNFVGQTWSTQFLLCTVLKRKVDDFDTSLELLLRKFSEDCSNLATRGLSHEGQTIWLLHLGTKGDLPALNKAGGFTRTFLNVPKRPSTKTPCEGICFLCLGGQESNPRTGAADVPYEDLGENPIWEGTMHSVEPWTQRPEIVGNTPVNHARLADFFCLDLWHCFHLGVCKHFVASALVVIAESGLLPRSSMEIKFQSMTREYRDFCRDQKLPLWITEISRETLNFPQGSALPLGKWNKGSCSTTMMLFLNFYCNKFIKGKTDDPVLLMIVPCFLVFIIFLNLYV